MGTEEEEAWNNFNVDSITLYGPEDSALRFEKLVDVSLEELKAAHNESANAIVGTWTSEAVNRINLSGTEVEESGEFYITFNADGSFTSNLPDLEDATWSYRGVEPSGGVDVAVFDVVYNGTKDTVHVFQLQEKTIYVSYDSGDSEFILSILTMS